MLFATERPIKHRFTMILLALLLMLGLSAPTIAVTEAPPGVYESHDCVTIDFGGQQEVTVCVDFITCEVVGITSTKGLSNVIWRYQNGQEDKFDDFEEDTYYWELPQMLANGFITDVWIHSGNNYFEGEPRPGDEYDNGRSVGQHIELLIPECEVLGDECQPGPGWASFYMEDYYQGTTNNGGEVNEDRSYPENALEKPDGVFYSLGVDGWLTVGFDGWVKNVEGVDLSFHEITNGRANYPLETLGVQVSQDGELWHELGTVTNQDGGDGVGYLDLDDADAELMWIQYVRVTELTDFGPHADNADGYDLDAVDATQIICPLDVRECYEGAEVFMIGDKEDDPMDNPADELSWAGEFGNFDNPTDNPFVVGVSNDSHFPWNSNYNQGQATDFEVHFAYAGPEVPVATLTLAWSPGRSGTETKQVYLDDVMVGEITRTGSSVGGWFNNMEVLQDTIEFGLTPGMHSLRLVQTSGDGTLWDYVKLELSSCPSDSFIQGRKYFDVNGNGNFDRSEKSNTNRLNGWLISLYDSDWELVDSMLTGDDSTDAGNMKKGQYRFENLQIGTYYVCETMQEGWFQSEPASGQMQDGNYCHTISIDSYDHQVGTVLFGNYPASTINGVVYGDVDESFDQEETEDGFLGWTVNLFTHNSPYNIVASALTGPDGSFEFTGLELGTYYVCQVLEDGFLQTEVFDAVGFFVDPDLSDQVCYEVVIDTPGQVVTERDFGNFAEEDDGGFVQGATDAKTPEDEGDVLGEVLADTGVAAALSLIVGTTTIATSLGLAVRSKKH